MDQKIYKKLNILEMHASFGYAGGQRNLVTYCKYLDRKVFNVFAAAYASGGPQEQRLKDLNIEYVVAGNSAEKILEFIKEKKIDIIHIHRSGKYIKIEDDILEGARKANPGVIIIEKNIFGFFDEKFKSIDCSLFQSMMHLNERYLPASGREFDFGKMKVFYNMVDGEEFEKYRLPEEEIRRCKEKLGIGQNDFVIGRIGRPDIAKWSDLVLEMMPYLIKLTPDIKFIIIGAPKSRMKIIEKSKYKNKIILLPETADEKEVHKFYQIIDVLAHSSKIGECNGNTINEAMFWRKPVVTNSTPNKDNGQLEQVRNMKNGIIANYPQTFARAIEFLYKNPAARAEMGENGYHQTKSVNYPILITRRLEKVFIEKALENGLEIEPKSVEFYGNISYNPNEKDILNYREEYRRRLGQDFGKLEFKEKIANFLKKPKKFYFKITDFLEHRLGL